MKHNILSSKISYLLPLVVLVLLAWGCSDKLVDNETNPVTVKLETSISVGELADAVSIFVLTVTGPDMEPIVAVQFYEGGPLVFELDIPAGPGRTFVLEGFSADVDLLFLEGAIYRGSAVADIEPNVAIDLTLHMEPVVPLIRFTPLRTVTVSGQSFSANLEIFNVPGLSRTELLINYDIALLNIDSITKGDGLDASDSLESSDGGPEGFEMVIYDPNNAGIVDETGYSHLATVYFTSEVTVTSGTTFLEITGLSYLISGGTSLSPGDVFSHLATVEITQFTDALVRLLPSDTVVQPEGVFGLQIEGRNLLTLYEADLELAYDNSLLRYDSVVNGGSLLGSDTIIVNEGSSAGTLELRVSDPSGIAGSIVDVSGYSHMATVYFTALRPPQTAVTPVEITPLQLLASESVGGSIPVANVTAEGATVTVAAFPDALMRFTPAGTNLVSSEYFTLDVELYSMDNLREIQFGLMYETDYVRFDSVTKGISLDASDAVLVGEGAGAGPVITVLDTTNGLIVDGQGDNSSLLTLYFRTNIIDAPKETVAASAPVSFILLGGGSIPVVDVALENATINIGPFPDEEIFFDDLNLETVVRNKIEYPSGPIMWSQVYDLDYLGAGEANIGSLVGIEKLVNLTDLQLPYSNISDLAPLQQLSALASLNLNNNQIVDITPLSSLVRLTYLDLSTAVEASGNDIVDVSPLASLANIIYLYLDGNSIAEISPLVNGSVLESGDYVDLSYNPLNQDACDIYIPALIARLGGSNVLQNECAY